MGHPLSRACVLVLSATLMGAAGALAQSTPLPDDSLVFTLVAEADRLSEREVWPGFDASTIPIAAYTGERTYLFRHPAPPSEFAPVPGSPGVAFMDGRHAAVTANSSAELGGHLTATVLVEDDTRPLSSLAPLLVHEMFHVYQREAHPAWSANEASLFIYPFEAVDPLALRRLEGEALRRALASDNPGPARCWARQSLRLRDRRFDALPSSAVAYERGTEFNEGLARYVEHHAAGRPVEAALSDGEFGPEDVRRRAYASGLSLALLLDRFAPGWQSTLESDSTATLDGLLASAIGTDSDACGFTTRERDHAKTRAERDVADLRTRRTQLLRDFETEDGWRIVVRASAEPLFPSGFDPINVELVTPDRVLHQRFLRLSNSSATIEILGYGSLTTSAGEHPLFNGVRVVEIGGLPQQPSLVTEDSVTRITADGVRLEVAGARVSRNGKVLEILLDP